MITKISENRYRVKGSRSYYELEVYGKGASMEIKCACLATKFHPDEKCRHARALEEYLRGGE